MSSYIIVKYVDGRTRWYDSTERFDGEWVDNEKYATEMEDKEKMKEYVKKLREKEKNHPIFLLKKVNLYTKEDI